MKAGRGFTLVEMMVTVTLVGIMASVVVPLTEMAVRRGKEQELRIVLREIRTAIDAYKRAVRLGVEVRQWRRVAFRADERHAVRRERFQRHDPG